MSANPTYKDMPVWQHSMRLATQIFQLTAGLPQADSNSLGIRLQQTAVALPTLIASGSKAGKRGFYDALLEARGSAAEMETLLLVLEQTQDGISVDEPLAEIEHISAMLTSMAKRLGPGGAGGTREAI